MCKKDACLTRDKRDFIIFLPKNINIVKDIGKNKCEYCNCY